MISQGSAPCKGCKRRHDLCHVDCPDYAEYRKRLEEIRAKEREARAFEDYGRRPFKRRWR